MKDFGEEFSGEGGGVGQKCKLFMQEENWDFCRGGGGWGNVLGRWTFLGSGFSPIGLFRGLTIGLIRTFLCFL